MARVATTLADRIVFANNPSPLDFGMVEYAVKNFGMTEPDAAAKKFAAGILHNMVVQAVQSAWSDSPARATASEGMAEWRKAIAKLREAGERDAKVEAAYSDLLEMAVLMSGKSADEMTPEQLGKIRAMAEKRVPKVK